MHNIHLNTSHYTGPDCFEELSQDQFLSVVAIMQRAAEHPSARWMLIPLLYKIPIDEVEKLTPEQRVALMGVTDFLYDEEKLPYKQLIRKIPVRVGKTLTLHTLYGPGDGLKHLTFGEFMSAELKLEAFEKNNDVSQLNEFLGVLYRRSDKTRKLHTDRRTTFVEGLMPVYAKDAESLPVPVKTAISLQYHGCKKIFPKLFPHVFPKKEEEDLDTEDKTILNKAKKTAAMTWLNAAISLANEDITKIEAIEAGPLHRTLKFLDDAIKSNEELKRKIASSRRR